MRWMIVMCVAVCAAGCATPHAGLDTGAIRDRAAAAHDRMDGTARPVPVPSAADGPGSARGGDPGSLPLVTTAAPAAAPGEFVETGEGTATKNEPALLAEKRAEDAALAQAIARSGVSVHYGFQDQLAQLGGREFQFVAQYIFNWHSAVLEYERVGKPIFDLQPDGATRARVTVKGKVVRAGEPDPYFSIKLDYQGEKLGLNQPVYFPGSEIALSFWVMQDCFVQILSVDQEGQVSLLFPNTYSPDGSLKGGQVFRLPDPAKPFKMKAVLPAGQSEAFEIMHIIVTKDGPLFDPRETAATGGAFKQYSLGDIRSVSRRLSTLPRSQWAMLVLPYAIRER